MDFRAWLIEALGLAADSADEAVRAALEARLAAEPAAAALQSALVPIARAAGLPTDADAAAVLAGVEQLRGGDDTLVTALQSQVSSMTAQVETLTANAARKDAVAFVDAAILAGRVGLKPVRDEYVAMHMADHARAERLVAAMPILAPGRTAVVAAIAPEGEADNPALLAQKASAYSAKLAAAGTTITYAAAVRAVSEGKAA